MTNVPALVIRGTIIGAMLVALMGWLIGSQFKLASTPEVAYAASIPSTEIQESDGSIIPSPASQDTNRSELQSPEAACQVSSSYPQGILQWCDLITSLASDAGLSPNLIAAVMLQESGGDPSAYSSSGAVGLLQVMPRDGIAASFECVNGPCFASRPTIEELLDPAYNVEFGANMLASLINRLGDAREALRAYGPMDVGYRYADNVLAIYERYR